MIFQERRKSLFLGAEKQFVYVPNIGLTDRKDTLPMQTYVFISIQGPVLYILFFIYI